VSTFALVLLVLLLIVLALMAGGYVAMSRRTRGRDDALLEQLARAERELAAAHAADKGWDPATLQAAARAAAAERFGSSDVTALQLVQVIDRPGTDADQAVFRVQTSDGEHALTLGRSGGVWGAA
jgi:hypothetical protein